MQLCGWLLPAQLTAACANRQHRHNPPAILAAAIWLPHQSDRMHRANLLCKGLQLNLGSHPGDTTHKHLAGRAWLSVHRLQALDWQSMSFYKPNNAWRCLALSRAHSLLGHCWALNAL